jgi:hypothetical protein
LQREQLEAATNEDYEDREDDMPTVVVLRKGDLSAEEAQVEIEKQKKEEGILKQFLYALKTPSSASLFKYTLLLANLCMFVCVVLQMTFLLVREAESCSKNQ